MVIWKYGRMLKSSHWKDGGVLEHISITVTALDKEN